MFYRTALRQTEDYVEPAFRPDTGCSVLLYGPDYAIVRAHRLDLDPPPEVEPVPEQLALLLSSGQTYPPALALALDVCHRTELDYPELCQRLSDELRARLDRQAEDGFRLLRAVVGELGYMTLGEYYWVLGYSKSTVFWVSWDYQIYPDHCSDFGLTEPELAILFPTPWSRRL